MAAQLIMKNKNNAIEGQMLFLYNLFIFCFLHFFILISFQGGVFCKNGYSSLHDYSIPFAKNNTGNEKMRPVLKTQTFLNCYEKLPETDIYIIDMYNRYV